jgi:hypothetical protein
MLRKIFIVAMGLSLTACAHQRVAERADYWRSETAKYIPVGASLEAAQTFFEQRGLKLVCCVNQLNGTAPKHYALERDVGQSIFMRHDVAILVETTPEQRVSGVAVQQWGVGF